MFIRAYRTVCKFMKSNWESDRTKNFLRKCSSRAASIRFSIPSNFSGLVMDLIQVYKTILLFVLISEAFQKRNCWKTARRKILHALRHARPIIPVAIKVIACNR